MTKEQIISLFPATISITEEMIAKGSKHLMDVRRCIGALALKKVIGEQAQWGVWSGQIKDEWGEDIYITTVEQIKMTAIKTPTTVTFVIGNLPILV